MSFLKKYACMYNDIEFTPEEEADIGRFCARLMKVATTGDQRGLCELFAEEFGTVDESTFVRINNYLEFLEEHEKEAQVGEIIGRVLGPLSLALAASPLIAHVAKSITSSGALKQSLATIYKMHPELKNDPNVPMYFQAVADFAPDVAKNPLVAGNVIIQMHRVGPAWVTPQLIRELIGIQTSKADIPGMAQHLQAMARPAGEWAKLLHPQPRREGGD